MILKKTILPNYYKTILFQIINIKIVLFYDFFSILLSLTINYCIDVDTSYLGNEILCRTFMWLKLKVTNYQLLTLNLKTKKKKKLTN